MQNDEKMMKNNQTNYFPGYQRLAAKESLNLNLHTGLVVVLVHFPYSCSLTPQTSNHTPLLDCPSVSSETFNRKQLTACRT